MDNPQRENPQWPDFLPPDFEESIPSAPTEQTPPRQPPGEAAPPPAATPPPRPSPPRRPSHEARKRDPERWFNQPAPSSGYRNSLMQAQTPVTNLLIAICVLVWMLQNISFEINDLVTLIPALGASEPWRFITSAFGHSRTMFTHIGFNMLTLWLMGRYLEPILGRARFLAVYLISALGGGAMFVLFASPTGRYWNSGLLGASGAVFGLFGAYLVLAWLLRRPLTSIWVLLGLNVVMAVIFPNIAWQAHLGGLIAGAMATGVVALDIKRRTQRKSSITWPGMAAVTALIVLALVVKYLTV